MQFSEILCLVAYDWFCADGSHINSGLILMFILNFIRRLRERNCLHFKPKFRIWWPIRGMEVRIKCKISTKKLFLLGLKDIVTCA